MTIYKLYEQQQYMYQNKVHSVENRIVSISQPWIRPIVRGKTKAPVEFGAKFDLSIDDSGLGRIEKISYDAYNESTVLVEVVEAGCCTAGTCSFTANFQRQNRRGHTQEQSVR